MTSTTINYRCLVASLDASRYQHTRYAGHLPCRLKTDEDILILFFNKIIFPQDCPKDKFGKHQPN